MLTKMIETLKKNPRTIVYTEGTDKRILESAHRLTQEGILGVVLLGKPEEVKAAAKAGNFNIDACQIIDPENYEGIDAMVAEMVKLRKGKMTDEQVRAALSKSNYFGTMLVKIGWSRLSVRWSYIFHSRYCTSSSSAHQNKTRQQHRKLLLHPCKRRREDCYG